jgi:phosphohistidine phosphatase
VTVQRRLVVMRHAKAEPYAATDHARSLTERGRSQAAAAGAHLLERGVVPDHVVVSTAARAQETWAQLRQAMRIAVTAQLDAAVYTGGIEVVLETLRTVPEDVRTLLFIGHNPTAAYLGHLLDDGEGDPTAVGGMLRGFPTAALVEFLVESPWSDLGADAGRVTDFWAPPGR